MARFSLALFVGIALALAACAPTPPAAGSSPIVAAPAPVQYSCEQQRRAAVELAGMAVGSMVAEMMGDYGVERRELRKALGLPEPAACPKAPPSS